MSVYKPVTGQSNRHRITSMLVCPKELAGRPRSESKLCHEATIAIRRYEPKKRKCFHCDKKFMSTGPHHRMCDTCRYRCNEEGMI